MDIKIDIYDTGNTFHYEASELPWELVTMARALVEALTADFLRSKKSNHAWRVTDPGVCKIQCIKRVRELLGCSLREAKDLIENTTTLETVAPGTSSDTLEQLTANLRRLGATVIT